MPILNGGALFERALESIARQDYPDGLVEILMLDGGSTDGSKEVAERFGAQVIDNPEKLPEPGVTLGLSLARGDLCVVMAADNGLPVENWLRLVVQPFIDEPRVTGAYVHIVPSDDDNSFTRYYCLLHVEPFSWFVYGAACNARYFHKYYRTVMTGDSYTVFDFTPMRHPVLTFAQAFVVRRGFQRREDFAADDILPVIQMIEEGRLLAYVPAAGVYHHHLLGFGHYLKKYEWRIRNSFNTETTGFDNRRTYMSRWRVFKKYLFVPYGLCVVWPFVDSLYLWWREKDVCMLWHAPACFGLSALIVYEYARHLLLKLTQNPKPPRETT